MHYLVGFTVLMLIACLIALVLVIVLYIFYSLGLYTLAKNQGLDDPFLAWIPLVNRYLIGELTGNSVWGETGSKWILTLGPLVCLLLMPLGIGFIVEIVYLVYYFMALYKLYDKFDAKNASLYTILSIFFKFLIGIFIFIIRNNQPVKKEETVKTQTESNSFYNEPETINLGTNTDSDKSYQQAPFDENFPSSSNESFNKENRIDPDSAIDYEAINKNIEAINYSAQKAYREAPNKPIKLSLEKDPKTDFTTQYERKDD